MVSMKKNIFILLIIILMMQVSEGKKYEILTGRKKGTYYVFGKSICQLSNQKMKLRTSPGSLENIMMLGL